MSVTQYLESLNRAYATENDAVAVIQQVKHAIIRKILELDPRVRAQTTDFFTHSFAPDIVLHWDRQNVTRPLFIRQSVGDRQIAEDLAVMRSERPIIFGLEPSSSRASHVSDGRDEVRRSSTLVTDASGVDAFAERRAGSRVVDIASPAILQGGQGLLNQQTAEQITTGLTRGFMAAGNLSAPETGSTVRLIESVFRPALADRLTQFLRAVWIGAGGSLSSFPGEASAETELTDEALEFLLEFEENATLDFWRRIGGRLTLRQVANLQVGPSARLDALIVANLDRINAKVCGLLRSHDHLEDDATARWETSPGQLSWRGSNLTFMLADSRDDLRLSDDGQFDPPTAKEFLRRADENSTSFESVELRSGSLKVEYGAIDGQLGSDVTHDPQLQESVASLPVGSVVRASVATIPGLAPLVMNFQHGIAGGRTAARFTIRELLEFALPILARPSELDRADISEMRIKGRRRDGHDLPPLPNPSGPHHRRLPAPGGGPRRGWASGVAGRPAAMLANSVTPYAALGRWVDLFVDFVVTKQGLAAVLQSEEPCFDPLHSYFLKRLEPVCAELLDAAAASGEIDSGQDPYELMRGIGGLCAGAGDHPRYDRTRLVKLLIAGLHRAARGR